MASEPPDQELLANVREAAREVIGKLATLGLRAQPARLLSGRHTGRIVAVELCWGSASLERAIDETEAATEEAACRALARMVDEMLEPAGLERAGASAPVSVSRVEFEKMLNA